MQDSMAKARKISRERSRGCVLPGGLDALERRVMLSAAVGSGSWLPLVPTSLALAPLSAAGAGGVNTVIGAAVPSAGSAALSVLNKKTQGLARTNVMVK